MKTPTKRELEIAESLVFGKSKKEVANMLIISLYTVETTIKNVYAKLNVNNVAGLAEWYYGWKFGIADQIQSAKAKAIVKVEKSKEATKDFVKVLPKTLMAVGFMLSMSLSATANDIRSARRTSEGSVQISTSRRQSRRRERRVSFEPSSVSTLYLQ